MRIQKCILVAALFAALDTIAAPITFEDTSNKLDFTRGTETWGIAWGHLDTDKYPDLWNSGHRDFPRLYKNTGTGDFDDVAMQYDVNQDGFWIKDTKLDVHGGSWADFDNDGDDDLIVGDESNLYINEATNNGFFTVTDVNALQQNAMWNNTDNDRELESDLSCGIKPAGARRTGQYILLFDIDVDGQMDQICAGEGPFPFSASLSSNNYLIPPLSLVNDTAIGDFDNDLRTDLLMTLGTTRPNGASRVNDHRIEGWFSGGGRGFTFSAAGEVTFLLDGDRGGVFKEADTFTLNTNGVTSAESRGVVISYDTTSQLWRVEQTLTSQAYVRVITEDIVTEHAVFGLTSGDLPQANALGMNRASGIEWVSGAGLSMAKSCVSVVTADFDNDMDLDVYMACRNGVDNLANRYYDNQGDGTFKEVINHGGEGPVGAGIQFGVADSVITADYDLDGFMDLAVSNGLLFYPVSLGGPDTLIRNQGNSNHWIELDLVGTVSPRAAIGAKVYVTSGGKTQLREQSSGYHRWSQNHSRIHVGLAGNTSVDEIRVEWPSGHVDVFNNVSADRLYDVVESGQIIPATLGQPSTVTLEAGEECGEPAYTNTLGPAMLIWRECGTDSWRVRAKGGLGRLTEKRDLTLTGALLGTPRNFGSVAEVTTDINDTINNSVQSRIEFSLTVQQEKTNSKGFNFSTNGQTSTCLDIDSVDFEAIYLGSSGKRIELPYDLSGLNACSFDSDGDGIDDASDLDDDNDGVPDLNDAFPFDVNESNDTDGDGVGDNSDAFPTDSTETKDNDNDGIGDNTDIDIDNDGIADSIEQTALASFTPITGSGAVFNDISDVDEDGVVNEVDLDSDNDGIADVVEAGLIDSDGDFLLDNLIDQGGITNPRDSDSDGIPDFLDLESNNAANDGSDYDINRGLFSGLDTNNDGTINSDDDNGGLDANNNGIDDLIDSQLGQPMPIFSVGNSTLAPGSAVDGWNANIVINETDIYTNTGTQLELLDITAFEFVAARNTSPLTPFVVRVDGDNDFDVLAIGQTHTVYNIGRNRVDFSDQPVSIEVIPGMTIAVGFLDANPDGSASNGSVIQYASGNDEIWYSGGSQNTDSASVFVNQAPTPGQRVLTTLRRDYAFHVSFSHTSAPQPPVTDACGEPVIDRATEQAVFLWKDCSSNVWSVRFTAGGSTTSVVASGLVSSDGGFTNLTGFSLEGSDLLDNTTNLDQINYELKVVNTGQDGFEFTPVGANSCFTVDSLTTVYLGQNKINSNTDINLDTLDRCDLAPVVDDPIECGEPIFDKATEPGAFLWKDCDAASNVWSIRIAGGGLAYAPYIGRLDASAPVIAYGEELEANDTLDINQLSSGVSFTLNVANKAQDGFNVTIPENSQTCFEITQLPTTAQIYVGRYRTLKSEAFNLENLDACL